jgi:formamidopyrimidine-DNA glycosylase
MPELPDVEVFRTYLQSTSLHKTIRAVTVADASVLEGIGHSRFSQTLAGHCFETASRHGKYCFLKLDDERCLFLHFGMTGFVQYFKKKPKAPEHVRLVFEFTNDYSLAYDCRRKLGRVGVTDDMEDFIAAQNLGSDAFDETLSEDDFVRLLGKRRGMLKPALMNQQIIAGIGNIYSDEILFQLRLHPKVSLRQLEETQLRQTYRVLRDILATAVEANAEPEKMTTSMLTRHRHGDGRCPVCGADLEKIDVAGRRACYCPSCQGGSTAGSDDGLNHCYAGLQKPAHPLRRQTGSR